MVDGIGYIMLEHLVHGEVVLDLFSGSCRGLLARILIECEAELQILSPVVDAQDDKGRSVAFYAKVGPRDDVFLRQACKVTLPDAEVYQFIELVYHHMPLPVFLHINPEEEIQVVGFHFGNRNYEVTQF